MLLFSMLPLDIPKVGLLHIHVWFKHETCPNPECMVLHTDSAYLWVLVYSSHLNSNRAMLAYVASGPSGSHSTLVCGTVAPGDQRSGVWHAVAHGCFPVQRQSGISSCVKQAHATLNFNADTKTTEIWSTPILMCCGTTSSVAAIRIADTLADDVSVEPLSTRQWAPETRCPMLQQAGYRTRELQSENSDGALLRASAWLPPPHRRHSVSSTQLIIEHLKSRAALSLQLV